LINIIPPKKLWRIPGTTTLAALISILIIACGITSTPTPSLPEPTNTTVPEPGETTAPAGPTTPTPIPTVQPTPRPTETAASRDNITIVIDEEPDLPDPWISTTLYPNQVVQNVAQPFAFFGPDFTDTATAGFTGFEQMGPNRWRFSLREGVKFHNGEPWNAQAAKYTIDALGSNVNYQPYSQVGDSHAEIVDEFTVDLVCNEPCPVLPRFAQYHLFVGPEHHKTTPQEERNASGQVIGWGPYEWVGWNRGSDIKLTAYEGYVEPQPVNFMTQAPTIKDVTYIWRAEEIVRSAMIQAGEADLAWAMAIDQAEPINNSENGKTVNVVSGEVYTLNVDTIWHPELRKLKVRQALAHAIDCEGLALALFGPESRCSSGPNGIPGTLGVTEENAKPIYTYDPHRARQLLQEANYDPSNVIDYWTREGRYAKDVELGESLISFWQEVGLNVELNVVENSVWNDRHLTGPAVAYDAALKAGATPAEAAQAVHESSSPPPCSCSPGLINFAPGGEYFDFGRQTNFYMNCTSNRSKNCTAEWHQLGQQAEAASDEERERLLQEAYEVFTTNVLHIPLMEIVSVWGVNQDLEFVNMPGGRRILVNTMTWTEQ
jgi:peptide/nickel transport system substrate-binding protein